MLHSEYLPQESMIFEHLTALNRPPKFTLNWSSGGSSSIFIINNRLYIPNSLNLAIAYAQAYHYPPISATIESTAPEPQYP